MIPLINILIILSAISAAQAGPLRRYANTTSQPVHVATGIAYQPYDGQPSLSLAPIQGITTLPFSQLAQTPAAAPVASSPTTSTLNHDTATTTATISYNPQQSTTCSTATTRSTTSLATQANQNGAPTSFWTFGDQHTAAIGTTVTSTITSTTTTYTTITAPTAAAAEPEPESTQVPGETTQAQNATASTPAAEPNRTIFSFDPLPTTTSLSTTTTTGSEAPTASSLTSTIASSLPSSNATTLDPTSAFAYPYPSLHATTASTMSTAPSSKQSSTADSASASTTSASLPVVVTGSASQASLVTSNTTSTTAVVPGITIVPQNPSVIYITVTSVEAGMTTTVTA